MKCEKCRKNEARVHLTQVVEENVLRKVDLCETCAQTHGVNDPTGFSLAELLKGLGKQDYPNVE
jgi:protein arginine kinase activator